MNHSVLIVICDFLVLSVLSLSLGVAPMNSSFTGQGTRIDDYTANILLDELKAKTLQLTKVRDDLLKAQRKLGYAETRSKQVGKLNDQLAQVRSRMNYLEAKLKKREGEIGKLPTEKLLRRLEKESVRRLRIMTEMSEAKAALDFEKAKNKELSEKMNALNQDVMRREDELTENKTLLEERTNRLQEISRKLQTAKTALGSTKNDLQKTESALSAAKNNLAAKKLELTSSQKALDATKLRLKGIITELEQSQGQAKATLMDLSYVRGRLSATEKELAESRSSLVKSQKTVAVHELELSEAQSKIADLRKMLKNAVGDLSKTQSELDLSKKQADVAAEKLMKAKLDLAATTSKEKATQATLRKLKDSLSEAVQKLRSDALEKYSQAAVLLKVEVQEKRFLINYGKDINFYLPEVLIGGKRYLISSIDRLSGMGRVITESSSINKLSYAVGKPKNGSRKMDILKKPILSLNADNRVCLLEVPAIVKEPIQLLNYNELKKRGLQDLTLFKYTTFGQESSSLEGRCSLGLKKGDNYLYVRNSAHRNAPQLKADVGDFIMTKQGQFVGIAVEVESFDLGRRQRVKFFVFSDDSEIKDISRIPVIKPAGSKYFRSFAKSVAEINSKIKHLGRIKKSQ
ncbi:MAG: hypothetical protein WCS27_04830 [Victivallaceae bacterium]